MESSCLAQGGDRLSEYPSRHMIWFTGLASIGIDNLHVIDSEWKIDTSIWFHLHVHIYYRFIKCVICEVYDKYSFICQYVHFFYIPEWSWSFFFSHLEIWRPWPYGAILSFAMLWQWPLLARETTQRRSQGISNEMIRISKWPEIEASSCWCMALNDKEERARVKVTRCVTVQMWGNAFFCHSLKGLKCFNRSKLLDLA